MKCIKIKRLFIKEENNIITSKINKDKINVVL